MGALFSRFNPEDPSLGLLLCQVDYEPIYKNIITNRLSLVIEFYSGDIIMIHWLKMPTRGATPVDSFCLVGRLFAIGDYVRWIYVVYLSVFCIITSDHV